MHRGVMEARQDVKYAQIMTLVNLIDVKFFCHQIMEADSKNEIEVNYPSIV